jgi:hypothetical protein
MRARSLAVGVSSLAALTLARRGHERRAVDAFYDAFAAAEGSWDVDGVRSRPPGYVNRVEVFGAVFPADPTACGSLLPSDKLALLLLPGGRAAVFVGAFQYREITMRGVTGSASPYGEVMAALLVTRRGAPPLVPFLGFGLPIPAAWRPAMLYLAIPVTHRWARDAGWAMGFPKFMADIDFNDSPTERRVHAGEDGRAIIDLAVPVGGAARQAVQPMVGYTVLDGRLLEIDSLALAYQQVGLGGRDVELRLGDHDVAKRLLGLGISGQAVASLVWPQGRVIMPAARDLGPAHEMPFHRGSDAWFGRYTVRYPRTDPVDQYAGLTREGVEAAIVRGGGRLLDEYERIDADLARSRDVGRPDDGRPVEPVLAGRGA